MEIIWNYHRRVRNQKAVARVEYHLVGAAAVAAMMPGAHGDDSPIISGKILETANGIAGQNATGTPTGIGLDIDAISESFGDGKPRRLGNCLGIKGDFATLVIEAGEAQPSS